MAKTERATTVGLDTSVVLRLLTGEPPRQARRALEFLHELHEAGQKGVVSDLVVAEAHFALHAHYEVPKREAVAALLEFLQSGAVQPEPKGCAVEALRPKLEGPSKPGFADRLIHAQYLRHAARVASFETAFRKLANALVLKA